MKISDFCRGEASLVLLCCHRLLPAFISEAKSMIQREVSANSGRMILPSWFVDLLGSTWSKGAGHEPLLQEVRAAVRERPGSLSCTLEGRAARWPKE